ncbi:chemotaxis response regulator protein-glutamate methylesterase [Virgibacillus sp. C22-A2]|uniref:Protein-glutamate methylesterase/protein-glutamine glutaminase n=1 Tax=Virgibacillus tibetensis TaxID=3042313 RepID=A0ABU6KC48_9BACI|nr:chemotaxis response regulator protein-glutamate methylesterase [Virgibacillus sp. C22-A2]
MQPIRVIVIDDSAFMRKVISDILESDNRIEVIATARNGEDGLKKIKNLHPDVVTLDVHMPIKDGLTALREIMRDNPVPVIMLSSVTEEGAAKTVEAISNGAVDFIMKPSGSISLNIATIKDEIIDKVIIASKVILTETAEIVSIHKTALKQTASNLYNKTIIVVGTSTGGPRALQRLLTDLPSNLLAPILIVQHMPPGFTKSLADRLNSLSNVYVKEAVQGEIIKDNTAYIAPGNYHMKAKRVGTGLAIELTKEDLLNGHRPAVDMLFESAATIQKVNKIAVILTGMGSDGAKGIKRMKELDPGTVVIAEAEESAIVYGMPKAAVNTNCVNHVVPINNVGKMVINLMNRTEGN